MLLAPRRPSLLYQQDRIVESGAFVAMHALGVHVTECGATSSYKARSLILRFSLRVELASALHWQPLDCRRCRTRSDSDWKSGDHFTHGGKTIHATVGAMRRLAAQIRAGSGAANVERLYPRSPTSSSCRTPQPCRYAERASALLMIMPSGPMAFCPDQRNRIACH